MLPERSNNYFVTPYLFRVDEGIYQGVLHFLGKSTREGISKDEILDDTSVGFLFQSGDFSFDPLSLWYLVKHEHTLETILTGEGNASSVQSIVQSFTPYLRKAMLFHSPEKVPIEKVPAPQSFFQQAQEDGVTTYLKFPELSTLPLNIPPTRYTDEQVYAVFHRSKRRKYPIVIRELYQFGYGQEKLHRNVVKRIHHILEKEVFRSLRTHLTLQKKITDLHGAAKGIKSKARDLLAREGISVHISTIEEVWIRQGKEILDGLVQPRHPPEIISGILRDHKKYRGNPADAAKYGNHTYRTYVRHWEKKGLQVNRTRKSFSRVPENLREKIKELHTELGGVWTWITKISGAHKNTVLKICEEEGLLLINGNTLRGEQRARLRQRFKELLESIPQNSCNHTHVFKL